MSPMNGVRLEEGRVLVDEQGWGALVDAAANPDPEAFAGVLGAAESSPVTSDLHWTLRAHIEATLGMELAGRSSDGAAVGASASSDGARGLLLLDTQAGRWSSGQDPVTMPDQERQVVPVLASLMPGALLEMMQVGSRRGLGVDEAVSLPSAVVTGLLWREPGTEAPTGGTAGRVAALLRDRPWRHWRVRVTGQQPGQEPVHDGLDLVVLEDGVLAIEALSSDALEVREVSPVDVLVRLVEAMRPGLAGAGVGA